MTRPAWFEDRRETPAQQLALLPLDVAALGYGTCARLHRIAWTRGWRRPAHLACRVISVGNLVVGGSGKTPLSAWLAAALRQRGHRVVLASRGWRRRGRAAVEVVSDGRHVCSTLERAGDEPLLLAAHAPGVPVLVGRDRGVVGLRAVSAFGAQVLVLDDGFQHHRLARDLDVVVVDGAGGLGNRRVLPRGPLREPLSALAQAHAVGVVDPPLAPADEEALARVSPAAHRFVARRAPRQLRPLAGGTGTPPALLGGRELGLLAGVARPEGFRRTLRALGARVVAERCFPDHHRYRAADLVGLAAQAPLWVTTEKDAVKILPAWAGDADLRVLVIEMEVEAADAWLDWIEQRLHSKPRGRDMRVPARAAADGASQTP